MSGGRVKTRMVFGPAGTYFSSCAALPRDLGEDAARIAIADP